MISDSVTAADVVQNLLGAQPYQQQTQSLSSSSMKQTQEQFFCFFLLPPCHSENKRRNARHLDDSNHYEQKSQQKSTMDPLLMTQKMGQAAEQMQVGMTRTNIKQKGVIVVVIEE